MPPRISLVIPAWNEARRLPASLAHLTAFVAARGAAMGGVEVVLVVEPCEDETLALAQAHAREHAWLSVIGTPVHRGKGAAVRTGMLAAGGALLIYMDADLSVPLQEVEAFVARFDAEPGLAVLVGNRAHARSRIGRRQSFFRRSLGRMFNVLLKAAGIASLGDTQCGFKAFRRAAAHAVFGLQELDGFAFDVEVLLLAGGLGLRVEDHPVEWINSPESKLSIVRDSVGMLMDTVRVRALVRRTLSRHRCERGGAGA